jgi:ABC-type oligopeptide transport system substrate-binding subunit
MMPPGLPGYDRAFGGLVYDPALARRLLAEAGFPGGRGFPSITLPVDQEAQTMVLMGALADQWRHVLGVRVHLVQYTHDAYINLLSSLNYQVATIDWTQDYPDPQNFLSQQLSTGVPNNNGGWSNRTFDRLVNQADGMAGYSARRLGLYQRAERIALAQAAVIPLVNPKSGILLRRSVHGIQIDGGYVLVRNWAKVTLSGGNS